MVVVVSGGQRGQLLASAPSGIGEQAIGRRRPLASVSASRLSLSLQISRAPSAQQCHHHHHLSSSSLLITPAHGGTTLLSPVIIAGAFTHCCCTSCTVQLMRELDEKHHQPTRHFVSSTRSCAPHNTSLFIKVHSLYYHHHHHRLSSGASACDSATDRASPSTSSSGRRRAAGCPPD